MFQVTFHHLPGHPVLVKIAVKDARCVEKNTDFAIPCFLLQTVNHLVKRSVPIVSPASSLGDSFDQVGGSTPPFLGGLIEIVLRQSLIRFS